MRTIAILVAVLLLAGCTTTVRRGKSWEMREYEQTVYVEPGGTLLVPLDPEVEREHLARMGATQCPHCDQWGAVEFDECWNCGEDKR